MQAAKNTLKNYLRHLKSDLEFGQKRRDAFEKELREHNDLMHNLLCNIREIEQAIACLESNEKQGSDENGSQSTTN